MAAAARITVGPDEEKAGVDFSLQLVPTAQISGAVVSPDGPAGRSQVLLMRSPTNQTDSPSDLFAMVGSAFAQVQPDGTFRVPGVPPGQYAMIARAGGNSAQLWAMQDVTVNGHDVAGITLNLQTGMTVSGHVVAGTAPFDFTRGMVTLTPADRSRGPATAVAPVAVGADGAFTLSGIVPGRYRLNVFSAANGRRGGGAPGAGSEWTVASAIVGGHDAIDLPFTVQPGTNIADAKRLR